MYLCTWYVPYIPVSVSPINIIMVGKIMKKTTHVLCDDGNMQMQQFWWWCPMMPWKVENLVENFMHKICRLHFASTYLRIDRASAFWKELWGLFSENWIDDSCVMHLRTTRYASFALFKKPSWCLMHAYFSGRNTSIAHQIRSEPW